MSLHLMRAPPSPHLKRLLRGPYQGLIFPNLEQMEVGLGLCSFLLHDMIAACFLCRQRVFQHNPSNIPSVGLLLLSPMKVFVYSQDRGRND